MVVPILSYGAELWGYEICQPIENVQNKFCKRLLKVSSSACNVAVLGELGRYPLSVCYMKRCIVYWLKILQMDDTRYPKACYRMLYNLDSAGRISWVTHVKHLLFKYGFGYVWIAQEVGNDLNFVSMFCQRLKDCAFQEWKSAISSSAKLEFYSQFKSNLDIEKYLLDIKIDQYKVALLKLRISCHKLRIETGRFDGTERNERYCLYCQKYGHFIVENELHFILYCPLYDRLRQEFAIHIYTEYDLYRLLSQDNYNERMQYKLSVFIRACLNLRNATFD